VSHPKTETITLLLAAGLTNIKIADRLLMDRRTVSRIRHDLGVPNCPTHPRALTLEEKWHAKARPLTDGHVEWTGQCEGVRGVPVLKHTGKGTTAARVAFRMHNGRDPIGHAKPGCGMRRCVAPAHQIDTAGRRPVRCSGRRAGVRYLNAAAKFAALTQPTPDGHLVWTGSLDRYGCARFTHDRHEYSAGRLAFELRWGRPAVGPVRAGCDRAGCLLGDHLDDTLTRRAFAAIGL
jgi:hypothetical protein